MTTADRSRSAGSIIRANVLTRFNAIIGVLMAVVLVFGQPQDSLFGLVILINSAVGIVQELHAKRILDSLVLLERAPVRIRRGGAEAAVAPEEVAVADVVLLGGGERIPVDGYVITTSGLEVDESLLTGEADPVPKATGDRVLSGSFVVAGSGEFAASEVGEQAYANRLAAQARRFELAHSQLVSGINQILRLITWVIVPIGVLLVTSQLRSAATIAEAMVGSVAGIVPMVPEGLVLLTSVAFAVGVIRLGRRRCLVQELGAVEVLARVDVLCVDKTGTLTAPELDVAEIRYVDESPSAAAALGAMVRLEPVPNSTGRAVAAVVPAPRGWTPIATVAFSSARKFSAAQFDGHGTWMLGAPDVLLPPGSAEWADAEELGRRGLRVLALGQLPDGAPSTAGALPPMRPAGLVVLRQRLRPDAAATLRYLIGEGVAVKVLSGDNAASVAAVAAGVGLPGSTQPVDARRLPDDPAILGAAIEEHSVFGRVTPQRKRAFVQALQAAGHTVAMTGDGVNDVLALKDADLGIAMGSGSPATRAVAKIVLLDNKFAALPQVLAEGRRVLGNIERVAQLFLVKTVYALILAVAVGIARLPYPLLPRHVTMVGSLTIGIPAFFLALAPNAQRARSGFVTRVLRTAVPAGAACGLAAFAAYGLARLDTTSDQIADRSTATLTLFLAATWVLALAARPYTWWRLALVLAMVAAFVLVATVPLTARLFALAYGDLRNDAIALLSAVAAAIVVMVAARPVTRRGRSERQPPPSRGARSAGDSDRATGPLHQGPADRTQRR